VWVGAHLFFLHQGPFTSLAATGVNIVVFSRTCPVITHNTKYKIQFKRQCDFFIQRGYINVTVMLKHYSKQWRWGDQRRNVRCGLKWAVELETPDVWVVYGNAEIAGLDNDGRMCGQLTELKLQNFIPWKDIHCVSLSEIYALLVLRCYWVIDDSCNS